MRLLNDHHKEIVAFLEEVKSTTAKLSFISSGTDARKLLETIINNRNNRILQMKIAKDFETTTETVGRTIRKNLNLRLKEFCVDLKIDPPVQLFFNTKGEKGPGGHFACCDLPSGRSHSADFISLKELKDMIEQARQNIGIKCESFGHTNASHTSPFMKLEKRLEPFYRRYPTKKDFEEGGSYCRIDELHEEIANKLREKKRCLILGNPGCGKTTLALALGYDFLQDHFSVYYHDASTSSDVKQLTDFMKSRGKNDLVILDNAHAGFESINNVLYEVYKHDFLLLVTSRNVGGTVLQSQHPDDSQDGISYIEIFKEKDAFKELRANKETIRHIINQYADSVDSEGEIGNIDVLVEKCKADYNILRFYVQAWKSKGSTAILSDVSENEILEDIFTRYLKSKPYQLELLKIAALSQYEIDVDSKWIKGDLNELQKDGLAQLARTHEVEQGRYVSWLRIYHPSVADFFLKAAAFKHLQDIEKIDEFVLQSLKDYLSVSPFNFFSVLHTLRSYDQEITVDRLVEESSLKQLTRNIIQGESNQYIEIHFQFIIDHIWIITKLEMANKIWITEGLFKPLLKRTSNVKYEIIPLETLTVMILITRWLHLDINNLVLRINFKSLGGRTNNNKVRMTTVKNFIKRALRAGVPKKQIVEFCRELNFKDFGIRAKNNNVGLATVRNFVQLLQSAKVAKKQIVEFCGELSFRALGRGAEKNNIGLATVINFIQSVQYAGVPRKQIVEFCEELNFKGLGKRTKNKKNSLARVTNFIQLVQRAGVPKKQTVEFCEELNLKDLGERTKNNKTGLAKVMRFIQQTQQMEVPFKQRQAFIYELDFQSLGESACVERLPMHLIRPFVVFSFKAGIAPCEIQSFCDRLASNLWGCSVLLSVVRSVNSTTTKYIESLLRKKTNREIRAMLEGASMADIGLFLQCDRETIRQLLPANVDPTFIVSAFHGNIKNASLKNIGLCLFNCQCTNRQELSRHFTEIIENSIDIVTDKIGDANLKDIDLFLWRSWLASKVNKIPLVLHSSKVLTILKRKLVHEIDSDLESVLGVIGTYNLTHNKIVFDMIPEKQLSNAKKVCIRRLGDNKIFEAIRMCANDLLFTKREKEYVLHCIDKCNMTIKIPNQEIAIERLRERFLQ